MDANEYLKEKSESKGKWGIAKAFLGTLVLPINPVMGGSLIINGANDIRTATKMSNVANSSANNDDD